VDRSRLLSRLILHRVAVEEHQWEHVYSHVFRAFLLGHLHGVLDRVQHPLVGCEEVEDRDIVWEPSDRTEVSQDALIDLVLFLENLVALPIEQVSQGDEVVDSTWCDHIEIAGPVSRDSPHAFNLASKWTLGHSVSLVLHVEELTGDVRFEVDNGTIIHEEVEVLLLEIGLATHDQVLGVNIRCIGALE